MSYADIAWFPLSLGLTVLLAGAAFLAFRHRRPVAGLRWSALALLPMGLYLTGVTLLLWRIGSAIGRFATGLVLSPKVWVGLILLAASVLLLAVTALLRRRGIGGAPAAKARPVVDRAAPRAGRAVSGRAAPAPARTDDTAEFDDIEEILRRRGIR